MKKKLSFFSVLLCILMAAVLLFGCATQDTGRQGKVNIEFWGWADAVESEIYQNMVDTFNNSQDEVYVNYTKKPGGDYERALGQALGSRSAPDIFYVPEDLLKNYVSQGLIHDLTEFVRDSDVIDMSDMWDSLITRYQFNSETLRYEEGASIWGLSKDLGVSAIFYNADALKAAGVTIVSVAEEDVSVAEERHGFYEKDGKYYMNNRISMTWEELIALSKLVTRAYNPSSSTVYGYYDSTWFNLVWSVGGDSLRYVETDDPAYKGGYYEFALDSTAANSNDGVILPSTREALELWVSFGLGNNEKYAITSPISPTPTLVTGTYNMFTDGQVAMFVIPRYAVPTFRRDCDFEWDVAPVSHHKDGILAGYTTSMCYSIAANSSKKEAAFRFMEYMAGSEGQAELAKYGFNVPNQKSVTNSDAFLVSEEAPHNNIIFAEGAAYQTVGDWMYLPDSLWIDYFEEPLTAVRNGRNTLSAMFSEVTAPLNEYLKRYTAVK